MSVTNIHQNYLTNYSLTQPANPVAMFQYTYNYDFPTIASAWLTKYNYEKRTNLNSFTGVEQLDDDRI